MQGLSKAVNKGIQCFVKRIKTRNQRPQRPDRGGTDCLILVTLSGGGERLNSDRRIKPAQSPRGRGTDGRG